jgi:hypothetical protein
MGSSRFLLPVFLYLHSLYLAATACQPLGGSHSTAKPTHWCTSTAHSAPFARKHGATGHTASLKTLLTTIGLPAVLVSTVSRLRSCPSQPGPRVPSSLSHGAAATISTCAQSQKACFCARRATFSARLVAFHLLPRGCIGTASILIVPIPFLYQAYKQRSMPHQACRGLGTWLLLLAAITAHQVQQCHGQVTGEVVYDQPGNYTFKPPAGVTNVSIVCVGAGGGAGTYLGYPAAALASGGWQMVAQPPSSKHNDSCSSSSSSTNRGQTSTASTGLTPGLASPPAAASHHPPTPVTLSAHSAPGLVTLPHHMHPCLLTCLHMHRLFVICFRWWWWRLGLCQPSCCVQHRHLQRHCGQGRPGPRSQGRRLLLCNHSGGSRRWRRGGCRWRRRHFQDPHSSGRGHSWWQW